MPAETIANADVDSLRQLNRDYIRSVQTSDVRRFDEILAEDFFCSNPDGSLVDRAGFLAQTARPVTISKFEAHDVRVRIIGDVAIIHARTTYTMPDGRAGAGRYTDVWARRQGRWLAVSAHLPSSWARRLLYVIVRSPYGRPSASMRAFIWACMAFRSTLRPANSSASERPSAGVSGCRGKWTHSTFTWCSALSRSIRTVLR